MVLMGSELQAALAHSEKLEFSSRRRNFLYNAELAKGSGCRVHVSFSFSPDWESQGLQVSY